MKIINIDKMLAEEITIVFAGKEYIISSAIPMNIAEIFIGLNQEFMKESMSISYQLAMKYLDAIIVLFKHFKNEMNIKQMQHNVSISQIIMTAEIISRLIWFSPFQVLNEDGTLKNFQPLLKKLMKLQEEDKKEKKK